MEPCILIVDDEENTLKYLGRYMSRKGFAVLTAMDGHQALQVLQENQVKIVVLDVLMPRMDGMETLEKIRQSWPLVQVIMLTGCASVELGIQGLKLGAFDYLTKPVNPPELVQKIKQALEHRTYLDKGIDSVDLPEME